MTTAAKPAVSLLIIDDNPGSLELLSSALAQHGLEILTASDPETGLDLVHDRRPQIVLTDLVMPRMSGLEVLERIDGVRSVDRRDPDDRALLDRIRRRSDQERRVRLSEQAGLDRGAARAHRQAGRGRAQAPAHAATRRRDAGERGVRRHRRPQPADVGNVLAHPPRGAALPRAADHRRDRHRQGSGRAGAAQAESGVVGPLRGAELLGRGGDAV